MKWNNKSQYKGDWNKNKINGEGEFLFSDGNIYIGQFKNNKRHGIG